MTATTASPDPTKRCSRCRTFKPLLCFGRDAKRKDGLNPQCRDCRRATTAIRYARDGEQIRQRQRDHNGSDEGGRENKHALNGVIRARRKGADMVEKVYRLDVFERDRWVCQLCTRPIPVALRSLPSERRSDPLYPTVDHVVPLGPAGGDHAIANVHTAHRRCNLAKSNRPLAAHWERLWENERAAGLTIGRLAALVLADPCANAYLSLDD